MGNYAGVDWASEKHDILVADEHGEAILAATFAHDERGLTALCKALVRQKVQLVAIERPDGLLIERLLDAGLRVMAMHPTRSRPPARGFVPPAGSRTGSTRLCSASWPGPTATDSASSFQTAIRRRRCGR